MKDMKDMLYISDDFSFYTLEGESKYGAFPSVFLRLAGCNLTCKGFASESSPHGCDSYVSWCKRNPMTFEELNTYFEVHNLIEPLKNGAILKLTGGEPLLQEEALYNWVIQFTDKYKLKLHIDFETNATITPRYFTRVMYDSERLTPDNMLRLVAKVTFTTSPKLSNNGDPVERRYKPETIKWLDYNDACFKFVVSTEDQIKEIFENYIDNGLVKKENVWLMPCCGSRDELLKNGPQVAEWCKKYNFKFSNRLHLQLWDKALKV